MRREGEGSKEEREFRGEKRSRRRRCAEVENEREERRG